MKRHLYYRTSHERVIALPVSQDISLGARISQRGYTGEHQCHQCYTLGFHGILNGHPTCDTCASRTNRGQLSLFTLAA